ncbi:MAG: tetratricopeptide repeat protein [Bacteroidetes bacterium]|nr:tetratricopeptide repeat protein [Bacteroidota bacterium]
MTTINKKIAIVVLVFFSARVYSQHVEKKFSSVKDYEAVIKHYRYLDPDSASYYAMLAMEFARQKKDSNGMASILLQQGMIDDNNGNFDSSEKKYRVSLDIFRSLNEKKGIAGSLIRIGVVELRNGNYDKAIGNFLDALKIAEESADKYGMMEANYNISWAYLDQNNFAAALQYLLVAEKYNQQLPLSNISLNIYDHFGIIYTHNNDFKQAESYLQKGLQLSEKPEYQGLYINMLNNLAGLYTKEGLEKKAISLQKDALNRSRKIGNYLRELQSLLALSKTYMKKNPATAIFYLKQAVSLAQEKKVPRQEIRYLQKLSELYKAQGNYREAFAAKDRQYMLLDSFFYRKVTQNIESLKAEYELSKSNAKIKELNYINNKHQLELKNSTLLRNITFAGLLLLLVIVGLFYNQNKIRKKSNLELKEKNQSLQKLLEEKEWLMKEIHHRVKNNLQIVISLLNTQLKYVHSDDAIQAISESMQRMQSISLLHQRLYQSDSTAVVEMRSYIEELVSYLEGSSGSTQNIIFKMDIDEIEFDLAQAIPVGLILNEALTNAIKHAFAQNKNNMVAVSLKKQNGRHIVLHINDNGKGIPEHVDLGTSNSMGIRLIKGLTRQLNGKLKIQNKGGLLIQIDFSTKPVEKYPVTEEVYYELETAI